MSWFMGGGKESKLAALKKKQVDELQRCVPSVKLSASQPGGGVSVYDMVVKTKFGPLKMNVVLPAKFPEEKPQLVILPRVQHRWVDQNMHVTSSPRMNSWNTHSNLGLAVQEAYTEFAANPPSPIATGVVEATEDPVHADAPFEVNGPTLCELTGELFRVFDDGSVQSRIPAVRCLVKEDLDEPFAYVLELYNSDTGATLMQPLGEDMAMLFSLSERAMQWFFKDMLCRLVADVDVSQFSKFSDIFCEVMWQTVNQLPFKKTIPKKKDQDYYKRTMFVDYVMSDYSDSEEEEKEERVWKASETKELAQPQRRKLLVAERAARSAPKADKKPASEQKNSSRGAPAPRKIMKTDTFLTHDWGKRMINKVLVSNHSQVSRINKELKANGIATWFDEEQMKGEIVDTMCEGINNTQCVCVFVTQRYLEKVGGSNMKDNCKKEFGYAERNLGGQKMIAIVMESECRNASAWPGTVGMVLGGTLYIDFSSPHIWEDETLFTTKINELKQTIFERIGRSVNEGASKKEDLSALLERLDLSQYGPKMADEGAEVADDLAQFSLKELKNEFGMKLVHAKKLQTALKST